MQTEAVINHIVNWLKNYATQAKAKGFVIGVSGGVDSAVVSTLAAKTGLPTLLVNIPIRQKKDQVDRANEHIENLKRQFSNVTSQFVDLTSTFDVLAAELDVDESVYPAKNLALANARSRLRMLAFYYYGQINGLLVTGTGNKVEDFGVGFFTKYGDGGVDISPIADLLKTQVYTLAKHLNVAESIQTATSTDGLWDADHSDEDQIGASYLELEWAMSVYETHNPEQFEGRKREVLEIYTRLHQAMLHKIEPIPVCKIPSELLN